MGVASIQLIIDSRIKNKVLDRKKSLKILPSAIIAYEVGKFIEMLEGCKTVSRVDRNFIGLSITEYEPCVKEENSCFYTIIISNTDGKELTARLRKHGFMIGPLVKAMVKVLATCSIDDIPSIDQDFGFPLCNVKAHSVYGLKNCKFSTTLRISTDTYLKIQDICTQNKISIRALITNAIRVVLMLEYEENTKIIDGDIIEETIFHSTKKSADISGPNICWFRNFDLPTSVKILLLIEKYKIPGKAEFLLRILKLILKMHNRGLQNFKYSLDSDDEDYSETKMIYNSFKWEVRTCNRQ